MRKPNERPWKGKKNQLLLVNEVVDREVDDASGRDASMRSRATILIGAASVVGAIQLGNDFNLFFAIGLILSLAAAVCGVIVVFPRTSGAFSPEAMRDELYDGTPLDEVLHHMVRVKLKWLSAEDDSLRRRSWFARIGFILLIVSIVFAALSTIFPNALGDFGHPNPTPSPSATP